MRTKENPTQIGLFVGPGDKEENFFLMGEPTVGGGAARSALIRDTAAGWADGGRLAGRETDVLLRSLRARDTCLLAMLDQHRYMATDQIAALFFHNASGRRSAQLRLDWLAHKQHLLERWQQFQPVGRVLRRLPSVFLLSQRGAALLAAIQGRAAGPVILRSKQASQSYWQVGHDLEVTGFLVAVALGGSAIPDQGLYHWLGGDAMRRGYQMEGHSLAPDAWGRYLTPETEIRFNVEWDRSTEGLTYLKGKIAGYVAECPEGENVLFVAPSASREEAIRGSLLRTVGSKPRAHYWTSNTALIAERQALGAVWQGLDEGWRVSLPRLPGRARGLHEVADSIGKPGWWDRRPGGGEGA